MAPYNHVTIEEGEDDRHVLIHRAWSRISVKWTRGFYLVHRWRGKNIEKFEIHVQVTASSNAANVMNSENMMGTLPILSPAHTCTAVY